MEEEEDDRAKNDAYLPIPRSLEARRATGINSEDGLCASGGWLRGEGEWKNEGETLTVRLIPLI